MASYLKITKKQLLDLHLKYRLEQRGCYDDTIELINALGGIDNILCTYLESERIPFTPDQMVQIHKILIKRASIKKHNGKNKKQDEPHYTYIFDASSSYLRSMLNEQITNKILSILYHKITFG